MSADTSAAMPGTRNATLADMVTILKTQRARRLDVVAPAAAIHAHEGNLVISGTVQQLTADGVTSAAGTYRPTRVADEGISDKLGIHLAYLRRLREQRPDLWDANVNGWLHGDELAGYPGDDRKFLVRLFQADGDGLGVARAVLSDKYKVADNLDALMATLDGIRQAGVEVAFDGLDLTERRLYARVVAPRCPRAGPGAAGRVPVPVRRPDVRARRGRLDAGAGPGRGGRRGPRLCAGRRAGAVRRVRGHQQRGRRRRLVDHPADRRGDLRERAADRRGPHPGGAPGVPA